MCDVFFINFHSRIIFSRFSSHFHFNSFAISRISIINMSSRCCFPLLCGNKIFSCAIDENEKSGKFSSSFAAEKMFIFHQFCSVQIFFGNIASALCSRVCHVEHFSSRGRNGDESDAFQNSHFLNETNNRAPSRFPNQVHRCDDDEFLCCEKCENLL